MLEMKQMRDKARFAELGLSFGDNAKKAGESKVR